LWGPAYLALRVVLQFQGPKRISAMVRVKDEEEFLYPAIRSIVDHVDEVVVVDNLSSDRTPEIIAALKQEYPGKLACHVYPYRIRRRGRENWELASTPQGRNSPYLLSTYYNWCLQRCSMPYILKWDGDMIATAELLPTLQAWRQSSAAALAFLGVNVHPDRRHLIAAKLSDPAEIVKPLTIPRAPKWVPTMTYTYPEWWLFPSVGARFTNDVWWCETLQSPYLTFHWAVTRRFEQRTDEPCYLHLRFCKRQPFTGYSDDFREMIRANLAVGPPLQAGWKALLDQWEI
jgi:glycosyltransferase involved in cell wall biosynthesis